MSELKVHIELTHFVQPGKIEIDANERTVNENLKTVFSFAPYSILSLTICTYSITHSSFPQSLVFHLSTEETNIRILYLVLPTLLSYIIWYSTDYFPQCTFKIPPINRCNPSPETTTSQVITYHCFCSPHQKIYSFVHFPLQLCFHTAM